MRRIKEEFLSKIEEIIPLKGLSVLEIGCGDGSRSVAMAGRCKTLTAIEPDEKKLEQALARKISNATFKIGTGEKLIFNDQAFDLIIFTLSLHHIPIQKMGTAIDEAIRVVRRSGYIIFLEPTENGTFFDSEIKFDACDGDERKEKRAAYNAICNHAGLRPVIEIPDATVFQFESVDDFIEFMTPKQNLEEIKDFLESNNFILTAGRRINIFKPA